MINFRRFQMLVGFIILLPIVICSHIFLLKGHLGFGFSDVDWGFILFYKNYALLFPNPFENLIQTFKHWGVYMHQSYYIGPQYFIFGMDFQKYQLLIHILKIIGVLLVYPFILLFTGSVGIAILSTILFAFSYPAVGTMYTVVTSSDYVAVIVFLFYGIYYIFLIRNKLGSYKYNIVLSGLLIFTLFWSTERFYPIMFILPLIEIILSKINYGKLIEKSSAMRLLFMYLPAMAAFLIKPWLFIDFIWRGISDYIIRIQGGDWHVLLTPFISMGSLIVPHGYWRYLGLAESMNLKDYTNYLLGTPFVVFVTTTFLLALFVNEKKIFIFRVISVMMVVFYLFYALIIQNMNTFSLPLLAPAIMGAYYLIVSIFILIDWIKKPQRINLGLFVGPLFSFLFIFWTWIASESHLVFTGVHRYLTMPGLGHSLFLGTFIYLCIEKLNRPKLRMIKYVPLLLMAPILIIYSREIIGFFDYHIRNGFGAKDQQYMRNQMLTFLDNYDQEQPSLFYFDFVEDHANGYYYDSTIMGGFKSWIMFTDQVNFNKMIEPSDFWNDLELLEEISVNKNGSELFIYENKVIPKNNLYAFKLKNKKVIEITDEILKEINFD